MRSNCSTITTGIHRLSEAPFSEKNANKYQKQQNIERQELEKRGLRFCNERLEIFV